VAIRNLKAQPADFGKLVLPETSGGETNEEVLVDFVARGQEMYRALGCVECHTVKKNDNSMKTGPNLFGLFQTPPRDREIVETAGKSRFTIKADYSYLHRSIREPAAELAVVESGEKKGEAYMPIMPPYREQTLSEQDLVAIGIYL